jgi:hypothetical protein
MIGMAFGAHLSGAKAYWLPIRRCFSGNHIGAYWVLDDQGLPSPLPRLMLRIEGMAQLYNSRYTE